MRPATSSPRCRRRAANRQQQALGEQLLQLGVAAGEHAGHVGRRSGLADPDDQCASEAGFDAIWASGFGTNLKISLEVAGGATALVLLVALPAAYYTARRHFPGRGFFLLLVLVTQMLQPAAMLVGAWMMPELAIPEQPKERDDIVDQRSSILGELNLDRACLSSGLDADRDSMMAVMEAVEIVLTSHYQEEEQPPVYDA